MEIIEKDILTVDAGIICQQVNCMGKMNSGLARQIREKWPTVYTEYLKRFEYRQRIEFDLLGDIFTVNVANGLQICSMFGQYAYGYDRARYTDYGALKTAFETLKIQILWQKWEDSNIYFPFNFGACRGGGDFSIIRRMIEYYFPKAILCKFPE